jgi:hypothetical protein
MPGAPIFRFRVYGPPGRTRQDTEAYADRLTMEYTRRTAEMVVERFQLWLSPGHKYNIGASGQASKNFTIQPGRLTSAKWSMDITEGPYPANALIRSGIKPGRRPPLPELRKWAADKGLELVHPQDYGEGPDQRRKGRTQLVRGKTKTYARARAGQRNTVNAALSAIANALKSGGTFRPTSNWYTHSPRPSQQGRFDYPAYMAVSNRELIYKAIERAGIDETKALIYYLTSGRKGGQYYFET